MLFLSTVESPSTNVSVRNLNSLYDNVCAQPVACFFGGLVAQEVVKFTSKFTPLSQWLHIDWLEVLPDTAPRYSGLACVEPHQGIVS
jgi:hypothetical protein